MENASDRLFARYIRGRSGDLSGSSRRSGIDGMDLDDGEDDERKHQEANGTPESSKLVTLGPRTLRTDVAVISLLAVTNDLMSRGDE